MEKIPKVPSSEFYPVTSYSELLPFNAINEILINKLPRERFWSQMWTLGLNFFYNLHNKNGKYKLVVAPNLSNEALNCYQKNLIILCPTSSKSNK